MQSIMQKIGAISKLPNRYQQLSTIAFAICVSIRYGIIDYPWQRYNKTRRKANRRRRTQNGKIRKKGKWRRGSSAMSIDVALSSCRGASRDAFSLPQERGCAGNVALILSFKIVPWCRQWTAPSKTQINS